MAQNAIFGTSRPFMALETKIICQLGFPDKLKRLLQLASYCTFPIRWILKANFKKHFWDFFGCHQPNFDLLQLQFLKYDVIRPQCNWFSLTDITRCTVTIKKPQ